MVDSVFMQRVLRHDRVLVVSGLLVVVILSWTYLLTGAGMMEAMGDMLMPMSMGPWTPGHAVLVFTMWAVMMAAMMLPGAAPMILLYSTIARSKAATGELVTASGGFMLGYVAVWATFSLVAATLQYVLEQTALLSPLMETTSTVLAGVVLITAGLYQWTPLKQFCLRHCRSPIEFLTTHWQAGVRGAFGMGFRHGAYCVGCCWLLMLLLFGGGVMNFTWIGGIALFILVEKLAPAGHWIGRGAGVLMMAWGAATLTSVV